MGGEVAAAADVAACSEKRRTCAEGRFSFSAGGGGCVGAVSAPASPARSPSTLSLPLVDSDIAPPSSTPSSSKLFDPPPLSAIGSSSFAVKLFRRLYYLVENKVDYLFSIL